VSPAWSRDRQIAAVALGASVVVALGIAAIVAFVVPGTAAHSNAAAASPTSSDSPTATAVATPTESSTSASPTAEPSMTQMPSPTATPAVSTTTTPPRDRVAPKIGAATSQYPEIWTNFWCSAGPNITEIKIPVQDPTDRASALAVKVRFVLHREDAKTLLLGQTNVPSKSSPFTLQLGPYPGPSDNYTYSNVVDMVVTATDRAGNKSTRTFASFLTFMDCKPTTS
jgi:hypothetical protein